MLSIRINSIAYLLLFFLVQLDAQTDIIYSNLLSSIESLDPKDFDNYLANKFDSELELLSPEQVIQIENKFQDYSIESEINDSKVRHIQFYINTRKLLSFNLTSAEKFGLIKNTINSFISAENPNQEDKRMVGNLYNFLGNEQRNNGQLFEALDSYNRVLEYQPTQNKGVLAPIVYLRLELNMQNGLDTIITDLIDYYKSKGSILWEAKMHLELIEFYLATGKSKEALNYIENRVNEPFIKEFNGLYNELAALVYRNVGDIEKEEQALKNYYDFAASKLGFRYSNTIQQELLLGEFYTRTNQYSSADNYLKSVLKSSKIDNNYINKSAYISALISLAELKFNNGESAMIEAQSAINLIRAQFQSLDFQTDKLALTDNFSDILSLLIKFKDDLNLTDLQILALAEESKAITLYNELKIRDQIKTSLAEQEYSRFNEINDSLSILKSLLLSANQNKDIFNKRNILFAAQERLSKEYKTILNQIRPFVNYEDFNKEILNDISPGLQIIEYVVFDSSGLIISIEKDKITTTPFSADGIFLKNLSYFKALLLDDSEKEKVNSLASKISKAILPSSLNLKENLLIIPSGYLSSIPFECLIKSNSRYLIEDHNIHYAYSLSVLNEMRKRGNQYTKFIGFAPSYHDRLSNYRFKKLDNSGELKSIASFFKSNEVYFDSLATKNQFIESASHASIIHMSGHADIKFGDDLGSYLAFSDYWSNEEEDALLTTSKLYNLDLNADLIVTSACNTGIGRYHKGEGIMSLMRAFIQAGTKSVVSSLWKADDDVTKEIMIYFYDYLSQGQSKDMALANAKRRYLDGNGGKRVHPYYWAGFIVLVDTSPIFNPTFSFLSIALLIIVLIGVGFMFFKKKQSSASS